MKKSKIITGLSAGFITAIALSSCSLVKSKSGVVLTYNGVDYTAEMLFADQKSAAAGEAKFNAVYKVAVRQYFNEGQPGHSSLSKIQQDARNKISGQKDLASSNASKNGTSYDTEWNKILTSNNVEDEQGLYDKFEYELEKTEFDDQFYENKLSVLKNGGSLDDKGEVKVEGYLNKKQPYHIKHILVKVSAAADNPTTGEITKDEAILLSQVVKELAEGASFSSVAQRHSQDTGSKEKGGDLGIMDRDTSFVNEFKLGTYLYESYFGNSTSVKKGTVDSKVARNELGLKVKEKETEEDKAGDYALKAAQLEDPSGTETNITISGDEGATTKVTGIGQIPYEAALLLGEDFKIENQDPATKEQQPYILKGKGYAGVDYAAKGFSEITSDNKAKFYPRNVIFNKYFNKNNIMVITPRRTTINDDLFKADGNLKGEKTVLKEIQKYIKVDGATSGKGSVRKNDDSYKGIVYKDLIDKNKSNLKGFQQTAKNGDDLNISFGDDSAVGATSNSILRSTEGRAIFVFRSGTTGDSSYQGIHFVCIERSPFINNEDAEYKYNGKTLTGKVSTDDYFTYNYPGQEGGKEKHPTYKLEDGTDTGVDKATYVTYANDTEKSSLVTRADSIKSKVKSYDSNLNTYVYDYLIKSGDLKFKEGDTLAQGIKNDIETWIQRKRENTDYEAGETWNKTWKTYYQKLEETTKRRKPVNIGGTGKDANYISGTIAEACAIAYTYGNKTTDLPLLKNLFDLGGVFHE